MNNLNLIKKQRNYAIFLFLLIVFLSSSCDKTEHLEMESKISEYENLWWQFNLQDAQKLLKEILAENPDYPKANRRMAFIEYYYYENYDKALELIQKAINKEPKEKENYSILGDIYFANCKFNKSIESYNKALELDSTDVDLYYSIAISFLKLNNKTEAKKFLEQAINLNSYHLKANKTLHLLYVENEEYYKAYSIWKIDNLIVKGRKPIGNLDKWQSLYEITFFKKVPNFHYEMGKLYAELVLYDEAKLELEKALKIDYENNEIKDKLNEIKLFINFRDDLTEFFISYYHKRIIDGEKAEENILEKLSPIYDEMLILFPDLQKPEEFNEDWFYDFNSEIEEKFKVNILYGNTNGKFDCHFGYVIGDTLEQISQWGKEAKLRIVGSDKQVVIQNFSCKN